MLSPSVTQNSTLARHVISVTGTKAPDQHFGDGVKSTKFNTFDPVPKVLIRPQSDAKVTRLAGDASATCPCA